MTTKTLVRNNIFSRQSQEEDLNHTPHQQHQAQTKKRVTHKTKKQQQIDTKEYLLMKKGTKMSKEDSIKSKKV